MTPAGLNDVTDIQHVRKGKCAPYRTLDIQFDDYVEGYVLEYIHRTIGPKRGTLPKRSVLRLLVDNRKILVARRRPGRLLLN